MSEIYHLSGCLIVSLFDLLSKLGVARSIIPAFESWRSCAFTEIQRVERTTRLKKKNNDANTEFMILRFVTLALPSSELIFRVASLQQYRLSFAFIIGIVNVNAPMLIKPRR